MRLCVLLLVLWCAYTWAQFTEERDCTPAESALNPSCVVCVQLCQPTNSTNCILDTARCSPASQITLQCFERANPVVNTDKVNTTDYCGLAGFCQMDCYFTFYAGFDVHCTGLISTVPCNPVLLTHDPSTDDYFEDLCGGQVATATSQCSQRGVFVPKPGEDPPLGTYDVFSNPYIYFGCTPPDTSMWDMSGNIVVGTATCTCAFNPLFYDIIPPNPPCSFDYEVEPCTPADINPLCGITALGCTKRCKCRSLDPVTGQRICNVCDEPDVCTCAAGTQLPDGTCGGIIKTAAECDKDVCGPMTSSIEFVCTDPNLPIESCLPKCTCYDQGTFFDGDQCNGILRPCSDLLVAQTCGNFGASCQMACPVEGAVPPCEPIASTCQCIAGGSPGVVGSVLKPCGAQNEYFTRPCSESVRTNECGALAIGCTEVCVDAICVVNRQGTCSLGLSLAWLPINATNSTLEAWKCIDGTNAFDSTTIEDPINGCICGATSSLTSNPSDKCTAKLRECTAPELSACGDLVATERSSRLDRPGCVVITDYTTLVERKVCECEAVLNPSSEFGVGGENFTTIFLEKCFSQAEFTATSVLARTEQFASTTFQLETFPFTNLNARYDDPFGSGAVGILSTQCRVPFPNEGTRSCIDTEFLQCLVDIRLRFTKLVDLTPTIVDLVATPASQVALVCDFNYVSISSLQHQGLRVCDFTNVVNLMLFDDPTLIAFVALVTAGGVPPGRWFLPAFAPRFAFQQIETPCFGNLTNPRTVYLNSGWGLMPLPISAQFPPLSINNHMDQFFLRPLRGLFVHGSVPAILSGIVEVDAFTGLPTGADASPLYVALANFAISSKYLRCKTTSNGRCNNHGVCVLNADPGDERVIPKPTPFYFQDYVEFTGDVQSWVNYTIQNRETDGLYADRPPTIPGTHNTECSIPPENRTASHECIQWYCTRDQFHLFTELSAFIDNPCRPPFIDQTRLDNYYLGTPTRASGCYCDGGWTGDACEIPTSSASVLPYANIDPCNLGGNGQWNYELEFCECGPGFSGPTCQDNSCPTGLEFPGDIMEQNCFGRGSCDGLQCTCDPGFQPPTCECPVGQISNGVECVSLCLTGTVFLPPVSGGTTIVLVNETGFFANNTVADPLTGYYKISIDSLPAAPVIAEACDDHGTCAATGRCDCAAVSGGFFTGTQCESFECDNTCVNGVCTLDTRSVGGLIPTIEEYIYCDCNGTLFQGPLCSDPICPVVNGFLCNGVGSCDGVTGFCDPSSCPFNVGCGCETTVIPGCTNSTLNPVCGGEGFGVCVQTRNDTVVNPTTVNTTFGAECNCAPLRTGQYCQLSECGPFDANGTIVVGSECSRNINDDRGMCVLGMSGPECVCDNGGPTGVLTGTGIWLGDECQDNVEPQCGTPIGLNSVICNNVGTCLFNETISNYQCICPPAYTGATCEFNTCGVPCAFGVCVESPPTVFQCACFDAYAQDVNGSCTVENCGSANPTPDGMDCVCPDPLLKPNDCLYPECPFDPEDGTMRLCGIVYPGQPESSAQCEFDGNCTCNFLYETTPEGYCRSICAPSFDQTFDIIITGGTTVTGCTCQPGWDPASNCYNPICQNGGVFDDITDTCNCTGTSFGGPLCDDAACSGHGLLLPGDVCSCFFPWTGSNCEVDTCKNGTAVQDPFDPFVYSCQCNLVYGGLLCDQSLCVSGTPAPDGLSCVCVPPFVGTFCDVPSCPTNAFFNSTTLQCECLPGFAGPTCDTNLCVNGNPLPVPGGFECACTGVYGLDEMGTCTRDRCEPLGTASGPTCTCDPNARVEIVPVPESNTYCLYNCQNGGTNNFTTGACICNTTFTGLLCEMGPTAAPTPTPVPTTGAPTPTAAPTPAPTPTAGPTPTPTTSVPVESETPKIGKLPVAAFVPIIVVPIILAVALILYFCVERDRGYRQV